MTAELRDRIARDPYLAVAALAALGLGLGAAGAPADGARRAPVVFSGEVARGQVFARDVGGGLVFRLVPHEQGWTVWMGTRTTTESDFVAVATPPFRGINPRDLEGWHFRNADNSGPNDVGPKNVNAPGAVRDFRFVTSEADHRLALETLGRLLWPSSDGEREAAGRVFESLESRMGGGRLTIVELDLGNLEIGRPAWIERMRFEVELVRP